LKFDSGGKKKKEEEEEEEEGDLKASHLYY